MQESSSDHDFEHDTQQDSSEMEKKKLIDVEDEQQYRRKEEEEDEQEGEILPSHLFHTKSLHAKSSTSGA